MKISDGIYLVGSGHGGFSISNECDCHVYLVESTDGNVLIDAGVGIETERIIGNIVNDGIDPESIDHLMLTHVHSDHAGGCAELKKKLSLTVYVPRIEAHLVRSGDEEGLGLILAKADGIYSDDYRFPVFEPDIELDGGETLTVGELKIRVIHTPGHSPGCMCYCMNVRGKTCLFSGDVVLHDGKLLFLNCPGTTMEGYRSSMPKLANLGIDSLFPGHHNFSIHDGQKDVDKAIDSLKHLVPPPNFL
ncbi:Metallo-beta-lactamase L1 type 3 [subsurface metagenome]